MSKLEKRRYKKWSTLNINVAKRITPTRDINQGRKIVLVAMEEELYEVSYVHSDLAKELFTEENDNKECGNTKKKLRRNFEK